jgi:Bardet-Biedl syndrome 1 protein
MVTLFITHPPFCPPPPLLPPTGLYDVDVRIVVACRDGNVYTIKNGEVMGSVIQLETQLCGIVRVQKNILVGCVDNTIHSFHIKGKKNFSLTMPAAIRDMQPLVLKRTRMVNLLLVGLANGEVRGVVGCAALVGVEGGGVYVCVWRR